MSERLKGCIEGVFEVLTLLNEDNHGRDFHLSEFELMNETLEEHLKEFFGNYKMNFSPITDFKFQLEKVYSEFCQNFIYKIGDSNNEDINKGISDKLNNFSIKKLFVELLNDFFENSSKVDKVEFDENYNYGLPYKIYLI
ncbi:hypothetical protein [uncultured Tenacibaculum sp.]|uniref:hypothetical protein n=1 Tax=uncultured Tenacibaculum sp. TaxID=174713 RepID=UPI00261594B0|nr:hypothetical protein [uncultured Tenacibaculum sp.]